MFVSLETLLLGQSVPHSLDQECEGSQVFYLLEVDPELAGQSRESRFAGRRIEQCGVSLLRFFTHNVKAVSYAAYLIHRVVTLFDKPMQPARAHNHYIEVIGQL